MGEKHHPVVLPFGLENGCWFLVEIIYPWEAVAIRPVLDNTSVMESLKEFVVDFVKFLFVHFLFVFVSFRIPLVAIVSESCL